jgi:hypothetical protein
MTSAGRMGMRNDEVDATVARVEGWLKKSRAAAA